VCFDQDWLAARFGARAGCSALVAIIVAAGRDAEEKDHHQHREGTLDPRSRFAVKRTHDPDPAALGQGLARAIPASVCRNSGSSVRLPAKLTLGSVMMLP
jgi:hypothetical protein